MCAADLSIPSASATSGMECFRRSEVYGRHGHGVNLMLARIPAVVVTARYSPPHSWRERSCLLSVSVRFVDSGLPDSPHSDNFAYDCTCRSRFDGEEDWSLSGRCDHEKCVKELIVCGSGMTVLGKHIRNLLHSASTASACRRTPRRREDGGPPGQAEVLPEMCSSLAFAISSSKLVADIACV